MVHNMICFTALSYLQPQLYKTGHKRDTKMGVLRAYFFGPLWKPIFEIGSESVHKTHSQVPKQSLPLQTRSAERNKNKGAKKGVFTIFDDSVTFIYYQYY